MTDIFLQLSPPPVLRGNFSPQIQRQTGRFSPISGWTFDQEFRGLDENQMLVLAYEYAQAGCEYEITIQFGVATLKTIDNRGNITIDTWEIGVNPEKVSSIFNPRNIANCKMQDLIVLARAIQDGTPKLSDAADDLNNDYSNAGITTAFTAPELNLTLDATTGMVTGEDSISRLWNRMKNLGQTDYEYNVYSLRHTTNASNRGYYNVADRNVGCIYTQSQFYSEITNRNYWIFPCPNEIIGALNTIFYDLPLPIDNYLNGALKGGSQRVTAANNRVNINTEYKIFQWSEDEYSTI